MNFLNFSFPKCILQTYSVFSNLQEASDVVVGPYNSVLTLDRLIEYPDFVVVLDNQALYRVATETMKLQSPSLEHINSMVRFFNNYTQNLFKLYSLKYF